MLKEIAQPTCLFGAGGHGRGVAVQLTRTKGCAPVFADDTLPIGTEVAGTTICFSRLEEIIDHLLIVTVGSAAIRRTIQQRATALGLSLTSFVADEDRYFAPPPGPGSVILAGSVVNGGVQITEGVIVNCGAIVEHGCRIGAYSHIAPGAVLAGDVCVGENVWIGANATVLQGLSICAGVTIGAGAVVTKTITAAGTYVGQPARRVGR